MLIVHQACKTGGFGAEIAAMVAEEGFEFLVGPIRRLGSLDVPVPFTFNGDSKPSSSENWTS